MSAPRPSQPDIEETHDTLPPGSAARPLVAPRRERRTTLPDLHEVLERHDTIPAPPWLGEIDETTDPLVPPSSAKP